MARIKSESDIIKLREGGVRLARILRVVGERAIPGASTKDLNDYAESLIRKGGDTPAFLGYTPAGAKRPYPAALCISINDEVVHGIPNESDRVLKDGDVVGLDLGLTHEGLIVDSAITVAVGEVDAPGRALIDATKEALTRAISVSRSGKHVGGIGAAVEDFARPLGYGIPYELGGHGVGHAVHEHPHIANVRGYGRGEKLVPGMVLALEPMLTEGGDEVMLAPDGYTFKTADGSRSAHFEQTIMITERDPEILTPFG